MPANHRATRIPGESLVPKDPTFPPNRIFPHLTLSPAGTSLSVNHLLRKLRCAKPDRHSAPIRASHRPELTIYRCWTTHKCVPSPSSRPQPILFTPRHRGDGPRSLRDEKSRSRDLPSSHEWTRQIYPFTLQMQKDSSQKSKPATNESTKRTPLQPHPTR
jgi:hypothetical protein